MLRPLRDRIVVKPLPREKSARLIVVDNENEQRGEVIAVGPGARLKRGGVRALDLQPGDVVRFGCDYLNFPEYRETGVSYRVLQEADIARVESAA